MGTTKHPDDAILYLLGFQETFASKGIYAVEYYICINMFDDDVILIQVSVLWAHAM